MFWSFIDAINVDSSFCLLSWDGRKDVLRPSSNEDDGDHERERERERETRKQSSQGHIDKKKGFFETAVVAVVVVAELQTECRIKPQTVARIKTITARV